MNPIVTIMFDRDEAAVITRAINPWRLLFEGLENSGLHPMLDQTKETVEKRINQAEASDHSAMNQHELLALHEIIEHLHLLLVRQSTMQPDPVWVAQSAQARAEGKILLIPDPEAAVAHIRETRKQQADNCIAARDIVAKAIHRVRDIYGSLGE